MTNPYLEDEDVAYERLRQERDDDAARLRDTLENITRSLNRLELLAENTELKTRLKVAESIVVHHQEMLHDIADWLSVIPHEIERVAMQKEIRDIPKIE